MSTKISNLKRVACVAVILAMLMPVTTLFSDTFADCDGPTTLAELKNAVDTYSTEPTVTLCNNISGSEVAIRRTVTINLNGYSISSKIRPTKQKVSGNITLTIEGSGDVNNISFSDFKNQKTVVIRGGTYTSNPTNYVDQAHKAYKVGNKWYVETKLTEDNFGADDVVVRQGQTGNVEVVKPIDSTTGVNYLSADDNIATVTDGVVTGVAVGNTTINVTPTYDNTIVKTINVEILPVLTAIDANDITVRVGEDDTILPNVVEDASITDAVFSYESADEEIATVDENGKVTGISDGATTVVVTASYTDDLGEMTATKTVNVVVYDVQPGDNDEGGVVADTVKEIVDGGLPEDMNDATDKQKEAFGADYKETGENLKDAINDGAKITTIVSVEDSVVPGDVTKTSVENAFKANGINAKNIEYFDVSVEMKSGDTIIGNLHKLNDRIEVVLADVETPEAGYVRQYYVIKYHNNIPTLLKEGEGFVIEDNKIKIYSDEFSIFAVNYQDTLILAVDESPIAIVAADTVTAPDTGKNTSEKGSANTNMSIAAFGAIFAIALASVSVFSKR